MSGRPALIRDRNRELVIGVALLVASAWLVWDAYEGRGRNRPFAAHFLLP